MDTHTKAFDLLYDSMPEARCTVRVNGRDVIERAMCSGQEYLRAFTDEGSTAGASISVRFVLSSEPSKKCEVGSVIELHTEEVAGWVRLRVASRRDAAGLVSLTLESPNE